MGKKPGKVFWTFITAAVALALAVGATIVIGLTCAFISCG